jgi:predicted PurR-regulated permease PerM
MNEAPRREIFRIVLVLALLGGLIGLSLMIVGPFLPSTIWAVTIAVATWPILLGVQRRLGRRRWVAVLVMSLVLLLVFVAPVWLAIGTVVAHVDQITGWVKSLESEITETPPAWVSKVPLAGDKLATRWRELAEDGNLGARISPYLGRAATWFVAQIGGLGAVAGQLLLTVAITAILYAKGETAARGLMLLAHRLSEEHGEASLRLAGQAIRGVALGVIVTALVQSVLGGIGLLVVGVPFVGVLTVVMLMLAVAQIGVVPVLACAVLWKYSQGEPAWGTTLLVWTVIVASIDNVLRPILIRRGADLPLLLIFAGVVGGLITLGLVGIFIGPVALAVTWKLVEAWVDEGEPEPAADAPEAGAAPTSMV